MKTSTSHTNLMVVTLLLVIGYVYEQPFCILIFSFTSLTSSVILRFYCFIIKFWKSDLLFLYSLFLMVLVHHFEFPFKLYALYFISNILWRNDELKDYICLSKMVLHMQDDELTIIDVRKFKAIHKRKFTYEVISEAYFPFTMRLDQVYFEASS